MRTFSYLLPALFVTIIFRAEAVSLSGRFSTAAHTFEREVPDSLDSGQFRLYQSGSLTLRGLGSPRLSFQTSLRTSLNILDRLETTHPTAYDTPSSAGQGNPSP